MTNDIIDKLESSLSELDNNVAENFENSIEKMNILTKIEELVFWLENYRLMYIEESKREE